eukprot:1788449-Rhodomonas_salina.1
MLLKRKERQCFREHVCCHLVGSKLEQDHESSTTEISKVINPNVNVLCSVMKHCVAAHMDAHPVILKDDLQFLLQEAKLLKYGSGVHHIAASS